MKIDELLRDAPRVIALGLRDFARDLEEQHIEVVEIEWRPPQPEDKDMRRLLEKLL
jgi:hypothetical protein